MLRQRSSEVMDRTQSRTGHAIDPTRPPYALHVALSRRLPDNWLPYHPNWLFSRAHDNVASMQTIGENFIANMANRLTDEKCK